MAEAAEAIAARIRDAAQDRRPLRLRGGGTKDFYGGAPSGEILDARAYSGIVAYEPSELVVTARCGTPLAELESALDASGQMLAFEPPHFGPAATLGGCIAAGLSGPRRASAGALRDFVLGVRVVDGRGQLLSFGGRVMKNVAGYDLSRLIAGSLGTLGMIVEASLKVLPKPVAECMLRLEMPEGRAIEAMNRWVGQPLPISATAWQGGVLAVRLSGAASALREAAARLGGERSEGPSMQALWQGIREQTDPFFAGADPLWRLSLPTASAPLGLPGAQLIEWNGGLRWLKTSSPAQAVRDAAHGVGGHATIFRGSDRSAGVFSPLSPALARLHRELKAVFDPAGILNPGRLDAKS